MADPSFTETTTMAADFQENNSDDDDDYSLELLPLHILIPTVVVVVLVVMVAVGGNLLVLVSYARDARLRTVSNLYLLNLAVCDVLLATVSMPFYLVPTVYQLDWPFGTVFCKVYLLNDYTLCAQSVFLVILVSLDQLLILRTGVLYATVETKRKAYVKIAIAWLVSFLIYGPAIVGWDHWVGYSVLEPFECDVEFYTNEIYTSAAAVLEFVLPAVTLTALNSGVYWEIRKRTKTNLSGSVSATAAAAATKTVGSKSAATNSPGCENVNLAGENDSHARKTSLVVSTIETLTERFRRSNQVMPVRNDPAGLNSEQKETTLFQCVETESPTAEQYPMENTLSQPPTDGQSTTEIKQKINDNQSDVKEALTSSHMVHNDSTLQNDVGFVTPNGHQLYPEEETVTSANHSDSTHQNDISFVTQNGHQLRSEEHFTPSNTVRRDSTLQNGVSFVNKSSCQLRSEEDTFASVKMVRRDSTRHNGARCVNQNSCQPCTEEEDFTPAHVVCGESRFQTSVDFVPQNNNQRCPEQLFKGTSTTLAAQPSCSATATAKRSRTCFPVKRLMKAPESQRKFNRAVRKDMKAAKALFIFVVAFLLLWTPYTIATVVIAFCDEGCVNEQVYEFFVWLLWFKAAVNPFLYAANNSRFKTNFIQILSKVCFCCRDRWNSLQADTNRNVTSFQ
ncbi:muscarinic acetylcholine receptor M5-like [Littorina saxatilis]|uniref:muscarinic acetylcholine receptor M5-like n=1 Tax=Littorina saxatilis TaxID=31220 RepID=UPI0038B55891